MSRVEEQIQEFVLAVLTAERARLDADLVEALRLQDPEMVDRLHVVSVAKPWGAAREFWHGLQSPNARTFEVIVADEVGWAASFVEEPPVASETPHETERARAIDALVAAGRGYGTGRSKRNEVGAKWRHGLPVLSGRSQWRETLGAESRIDLREAPPDEGEATEMSERRFTEQIVVRVSPEQRQWLDEVSVEDGRTVAQTVRWLIQLVIDNGLPR